MIHNTHSNRPFQRPRDARLPQWLVAIAMVGCAPVYALAPAPVAVVCQGPMPMPTAVPQQSPGAAPSVSVKALHGTSAAHVRTSASTPSLSANAAAGSVQYQLQPAPVLKSVRGTAGHSISH
jgi:hypothetical protein